MRGGDSEIWTGKKRPRGDWVPTGAIRDVRDKGGKLLSVSRQKQRVKAALADTDKTGRYRVERIGKGTRWLRRAVA